MLENLLISIEAVAPMFIIMAIGMIVRKRGLLNDEETKHVNKMVFKVFFPLMLFSNIYGKDISKAINIRLMVFGVVVALILYVATFLFVVNVEKNRKSRGAMIQAVYRSNFIIMGMPIAENMFGSDNIGVTSVMITVIIPLYNILAVMTLEYFRGENPKVGEVILEVFKNPLIIGCLSGIFAVLVNLRLPIILEKVVLSMSQVASPLAILLLGASFTFSGLAKEKRNLIICVVGRLVFAPILGVLGGVAFGFRGIELITLVAIFASPSAITSFTMAQQMDSNYELAGNAVVVSSVLSCLTMFLWVFSLKSFGLV